MKMRLDGVVVMALMFMVLVCVPQAYATAELKLNDGTTFVDITDGSAGDSCLQANCVTFSGVLGLWNINVDTGTSKDAASPNLMDLTYNAHTTATAAPTTLTITFSDTGFSPSVPAIGFQIGGTLTSGGTLVAQLFGGNSNTIFDESHQIGLTDTFTSSPYSATGSGLTPGVSPYSLTEVLKISYVPNSTGQTTGDFSAAVPEPASVALLGGVLLFTVSAIRRKARRAS